MGFFSPENIGKAINFGKKVAAANQQGGAQSLVKKPAPKPPVKKAAPKPAAKKPAPKPALKPKIGPNPNAVIRVTPVVPPPPPIPTYKIFGNEVKRSTVHALGSLALLGAAIKWGPGLVKSIRK